MANFKDSNKFKVHDDYYTTYDTWERIKHLIPDSVNTIWEACMLNSVKSTSPQILENITGKQVIWDTNMDILENQMDRDSYDMIITNIPFETQIHYQKLIEDGSMEYKKNTSFYSVFVAYKMDLTGEQLWV